MQRGRKGIRVFWQFLRIGETKIEVLYLPRWFLQEETRFLREGRVETVAYKAGVFL